MTTIKALDPGEAQQLLAACKTQRDRTCLALLYYAAFRIADAVTLRLEDIDTMRGLLKIWDGKHRKSTEYDVATLPLRAFEEIRAYLPQRVPGATLLTTSTGNPVSRFHYNRLIAKIGLDALDKHVTPHMLRHTIATELAMDHKMPLYLLMKLLRHKHLGTTQQYLHVRPEWTEEAREYMDRVS